MKFGYFCNTTNWTHKPYDKILDETKEITEYCDKNNYIKALKSIRAKTILMPCNQDLYFRTEDNKFEKKFISRSSLRPVDSPFGHCAANPGNDKNFEKQLDKNIKELLN